MNLLEQSLRVKAMELAIAAETKQVSPTHGELVAKANEILKFLEGKAASS